MTPLAIFLICLALVVVLLLLSIVLTPSARTGGEPMSRSTRFFLVALRLAIGWHFLTAGIDKLHNPSWSSENYLRASTGPLAGYFRGVADEELLAKLTPGSSGEFPPALDSEWRRYLDVFVQEFRPDPKQIAEQFKDHPKD